MNFSAVSYDGKIIGYSSITSGVLYFFGTTYSASDNLQKCFPDLSFRYIQQMHGDHIVPSSLKRENADAHWTIELKTAPIIATADCVPILISNENCVCAIHAGWRGVANEILIKSILKIPNSSLDLSALKIVFGPHIQQASFEVELALANQFQVQHHKLGGKDSVVSFSPTTKGKAYINLKQILKQQLFSQGLTEKNIFDFAADTMTDLRFWSYRRQKAMAGRNLSFVARLTS